MTDAGTTAGSSDPRLMQDGDDFVCPNCRCEIMLKHHGDHSRMDEMHMFVCCCGTEMQYEHPKS